MLATSIAASLKPGRQLTLLSTARTCAAAMNGVAALWMLTALTLLIRCPWLPSSQ